MANTTDIGRYPEGWDFSSCTAVGPLCPVEATTYGYIPNVYSNAIFTGVFGICTAVTLFIGARKRTWSFSGLVAVACLMETIGYVGRLLLRDNPFNNAYQMIQLCMIVIAPTLFSAALYLTLKHLALAIAPSISRIRPSLYTPLFLTGDLVCLVIQGTGGGIASTASDAKNRELAQTGEHLMIAGVVLQVAVLTVFGGFIVDFLLSARRYYADPARMHETGYARWLDPKLRRFIAAVIAAYCCIWARCVYRIAEMADGWGSAIMKDQISFIVLEGCMISLAAIILTAFAPGIFFPQMGTGHTEMTSSSSELSTIKQPSSINQDGEYMRV